MIALDIGSTFTKGALFGLETGECRLIARAATPTTADHLPDGALAVLRRLLDLPAAATWGDISAETPVLLSSSAKGGLRVAVVGLVPELSLQIGRLAAWSAGARITAAYPYRLTRSAIAEIEREQPDILLLCGGTDGGHERTGRENAEALARSAFAGTIIYAGNAMVADEVRDRLGGKRLVVTENVMPDFGRFNGDPAREAIRAVFLREIVRGKGLDALMQRLGTEPVPTPRAMFDLVGAVAEHCPGWRAFAVVDLGGATTDVYSFAEAFRGGEGVVLRGIVEPTCKRSVEGDLGLRVSARSLLAVLEGECANTSGYASLTRPTPVLEGECAGASEAAPSLRDWVERVSAHPALLPGTPSEEAADAMLAAGCVRHAMRRHAGRLDPVWTPGGRVWVQTGKDLRVVSRLVLTGGYPSAHPETDLYALTPGPSPEGRGVSFPALSPSSCRGTACAAPPGSLPEAALALMPRAPVRFVDHLYLWPLLGSLASRAPAAAARLAVACLRALPAPSAQDAEPFPTQGVTTP